MYSVKSTQESSKTKRLLGLKIHGSHSVRRPSSMAGWQRKAEAFEFCDARRPRTPPHSGSQHTHTHMHYIYAQPHKTHESRFDTITALPVPQPQRLAPPTRIPIDAACIPLHSTPPLPIPSKYSIRLARDRARRYRSRWIVMSRPLRCRPAPLQARWHRAPVESST